MSRTRTCSAFLCLLLLPLLVSSCASMNDVVKDKDKGTSAVYPVTTDQAFDIARAVFRWEGCDAIEEHRDQGYMLTSSGMNLLSDGTVMGAWAEPDSPGGTKVTVVTKRRISFDIATTLTETTFHRRFQQAVDIVRSGKPLPAQPPELPSEAPPD